MKDINDLRAMLFETMQDVRSGKLEVGKAKAVTELAQTIVNTAKVEVDFMRATGTTERSRFISNDSRGETKPEALSPGVTRVWGNRIAG